MHWGTQFLSFVRFHAHTHTQANTQTKQTRLSSSDCCIQEKISLEIFHLARRQQVFPGLLHNLGDLDLHDLSVGAASVALRWWLQTSPPGERLNVITGVGKSRKAWRDADLRAAVAEMLKILGQSYMQVQNIGDFGKVLVLECQENAQCMDLLVLVASFLGWFVLSVVLFHFCTWGLGSVYIYIYIVYKGRIEEGHVALCPLHHCWNWWIYTSTLQSR